MLANFCNLRYTPPSLRRTLSLATPKLTPRDQGRRFLSRMHRQHGITMKGRMWTSGRMEAADALGMQRACASRPRSRSQACLNIQSIGHDGTHVHGPGIASQSEPREARMTELIRPTAGDAEGRQIWRWVKKQIRGDQNRPLTQISFLPYRLY